MLIRTRWCVINRPSRSSRARLEALSKTAVTIGLVAGLVAASAVGAYGSPGDLDFAFGDQGVATVHAGDPTDIDVAKSAAVTPSGLVVLAGAAAPKPSPGSTTPPSAKVAVARLTSGGTPDTTFGSGGSTVTDLGGLATAVKVAIQADGKIVVVALMINPTTPSIQTTLLRYTAAGVLDNTFGVGGKVTIQPTAANVAAPGLAIDAADHIIVGGTATTASGSPQTPFVERFTTVGVPDPTFGPGGTASPPDPGAASSVAVLPDGHVVLGGQANQSVAVWRFSASGALDTAYGAAGKATYDLPAPFGATTNLAAGPDNTVVAVGLLGLSPFAVRFTAAGHSDPTFGQNGLTGIDLPHGALATGVVVSPDRTVLIGGLSDSGFVARLNGDGTPDRTFAPGGKAQLRINPTSLVLATGGPALGPDNKPVLAGIKFRFNFQATPPTANVDLAAIRFQGGSGSVTPAADTATRRAGSDRVATAVAVSQATFADASKPSDARVQAGQVVVASSEAFPDALVGTPLAAAQRAPLLLSHAAALDDVTLTEIRRVLGSPGHGQPVTVLGGTSALSSAVSDAIVNAGFTVQRIAGANRYDTAAQVATATGLATTVFEATGHDFADGVTAGAVAAHFRGVVLLTDGDHQAPETQAFINTHQSAPRYAIGGPAATVDPMATPVVGADRYDTSVQVARRLFATPSNVGIATGGSYPDALSGGSRQSVYGGPILLTKTDSLPDGVDSYLRSISRWVDTADIYGGATAVNDAVVAAVQRAIS